LHPLDQAIEHGAYTLMRPRWLFVPVQHRKVWTVQRNAHLCSPEINRHDQVIHVHRLRW
jgi:hypothetical protein